MEITFRLVNPKTIEIINAGEVIGHIFTPSGSGSTTDHAIQICGFDYALDFWGCGPFVTKPPWEKYPVHKKDIQLSFSTNTTVAPISETYDDGRCNFCFNDPCTCEIQEAKHNPLLCPYAVKRLSEVVKLRTVNELTK